MNISPSRCTCAGVWWVLGVDPCSHFCTHLTVSRYVQVEQPRDIRKATMRPRRTTSTIQCIGMPWLTRRNDSLMNSNECAFSSVHDSWAPWQTGTLPSQLNFGSYALLDSLRSVQFSSAIFQSRLSKSVYGPVSKPPKSKILMVSTFFITEFTIQK